MKQYCVYIMTNASGTLYTGVTNSLERRVWEHRSGSIPGFTAKYKVSRLLYFEATQDVTAAITREKQIKGWLGKKKLDLIKSMNPKLDDLSREWLKT
jgi:putative endonuclease